MKEFKAYTENLMKVVLVPDETSDSVEQVDSEPAPSDNFSQSINDYFGADEGESGCDSCGCDAAVDTDEETDIDGASSSVSFDTNGLKVSFNGMEVTLPNDVVEQIKDAIGTDSEPDDEVTDDATEEDGDEEVRESHLKESEGNDKYSDMKRLGFDLYPGCRTSVVETAVEELGVPIGEIIAKFSDDDVLEAVDYSLRLLGYYDELDDNEEV